MDTTLIEADIEDHRKNMDEAYDPIAELIIPFFILHRKLFEQALKLQENKYALSNGEADALISAYVSADNTGKISPKTLQEKLLFTSGAITKVLKKLEAKEYIIRIESTWDKRNKPLKLTDSGKQVAQDLFADIMKLHIKNFAPLSSKEKKSLKNNIMKVLNHL